MALSAESFLWPLGELALELFPEDIDPEEVIWGYLTQARAIASGMASPKAETVIENYVYWKAYHALYIFALSQPKEASLPEQGGVVFELGQADRLLAEAVKRQAAYEAAVVVTVVDDSAPRGAARNKYVF